VAPETVNALIDSEGMIAIPTYGESRGHPARFHGSLVKEFLALADEPAHVVVRKDLSRVVEVAVEDPAVVMKMNTIEEYEFCLAAYRRMTGC
jgi:CTP:molybdopterin cytidylyltransferase MocA